MRVKPDLTYAPVVLTRLPRPTDYHRGTMHRILLLAVLLAGFAFGQTPQTFDRINMRTQNAIEFADQYPGPDAFAKINAAIAALPPTGGTVDARGFAATPQPVSTPLVIGSATKPVVLMMSVVASPTSPPPPGTVWSAWVSSPGKVSLNECAVTP